MSSTIAVVGMACCYPEAPTPKALWENVLAQRRAFRRLPAERLNLNDYFAEAVTAADSTYCTQAAVIEGYQFDRIRYHVAGDSYRSADLTHWLALDVAAQALADAGFAEGQGLDKTRTGVLVGNTLTGEFSRAALMRLRWPYVRRLLEAKLQHYEWSAKQRQQLLSELEQDYKQPFAPVDAETLAGGLSNTIGGRICNYFDFKGGGYTLDGACSSSLLAIAQACRALSIGDLEVAVVGGVDLSLDPFELIGFAKTGALARHEMRVYDAAANGFWPGEGCGFVVLMRHETALALGARCYAVIQGWGISSDGQGGITRPETEGQQLALKRAYARANYDIDSVALFEGHGTGTPVGDEVELRSLIALRQSALPAAISSVKANIGHTKAAAGIAGLIKATLALQHQVLPPATAVNQIHPVLAQPDVKLQLLTQAQPWPQAQPLRAGVNAFGFGGINVHIALEGIDQHRRSVLSPYEHCLSRSTQDNELLLLAATDWEQFAEHVQQLSSIAPQLSLSELSDLAALLAQNATQAPIRAAIITANPSQFTQQLQRLSTWLAVGEKQVFEPKQGLFLAEYHQQPRITFLFPGQSAPVHLSGGLWTQRFAAIDQLYHQAGLTALQGEDPIAPHVAQPAVITASLAGLKLLTTLDLKAHQALGHSLGEFAALFWGGAIDAETTLLNIINARSQVLTAATTPETAMLSVRAAASQVEKFCARFEAVIACYNGPQQTVIAGERSALAQLERQLKTHGFKTAPLAVSHGFHCPLLTPVAEAFNNRLAEYHFQPLRQQVISTVTAKVLEAHTDIHNLLTQQMIQPVQFSQALELALTQTELILEVGPGTILTNLVKTVTDIPVVSLEVGAASLRGLLTAVGAAYVAGAAIKPEVLFADRFTRPFSLPWQPKFFVNPCELAPLPAAETTVVRTATDSGQSNPDTETTEATGFTPQASEQPIIEQLRQLVAAQTELPLNEIDDQSRLLTDLHLNSIRVGQLITKLAQQLGLTAPLDSMAYATATLTDIAQAFEQRLLQSEVDVASTPILPAGVDTWIRAFAVEWQPQPLRGEPQSALGEGGWRVLAHADYPWKNLLSQHLNAWGGGGVAVCVAADQRVLNLVLQGIHTVLYEFPKRRYFVVIQHGQQSIAALARTLSQEAPQVKICVLNLPVDANPVDSVLQELQYVQHYHEVYYAAEQIRHQRIAQALAAPLNPQCPLTTNDVLLVSGGGKGITAECALTLAQHSGARVALLGRATPEQDSDLATNLQRFQAAQIDFRYLTLDITDVVAVDTTLKKLTADWGPITAVLHGAGTNQPKLLGDLDEAACQRTLAPKVQGLSNLLAAIEPQHLRLLISFGSIIAPLGLAGEADYALANDWLAELTADFQAAHPHCRCLTLDWSVWSEVGMGARLGRVETLAQQGITPITPEVGKALFHQALGAEHWPQRVIISGRWPETATLTLARTELPFLRFLEQQPRVDYPQVELIVDTELSTLTDPYLREHQFEQQNLLPAVMGLEAMAQVAATVLGVAQAPLFETVLFNRPIVVEHTETIRIAALVKDAQTVDVVLRCGQTDFQIDHFRARCRFTAPIDLEVVASLHQRPAALEPQTELYQGGLLFQRGRFQRVQRYHHLEARYCDYEIASDATTSWFGRYLSPNLLLGDPGARDAAIHAIQAGIPHAQLLPLSIERLQFVDTQPCSHHRVSAQERWRQGDLFCYDLTIRDAHTGQVREIWHGLQLKQLSPIQWPQGWPQPLLAPYIERRLQELLATTVQVALEDHLQANSEVAFAKLLGTEAEIVHQANGKPQVVGLEHLSISAAHCQTLTLVVASETKVACDLEQVMAREATIWQGMLGAGLWGLGQMVAQQQHEDLDTTATRLWTLKECLKKAGMALETPVTLHHVADDNWLLFTAGAAMIASYIGKLKSQEPSLAVAILVGVNDATSV